MTPSKIGRYQVLSELGRGGMATVYCARDPIAERDVAIKVLPPEMMHDPQFKVRFAREAKLIAKLEHPAIVPVYDFGEDEGLPYFVMRYMTGGSLSDRLKKAPLTVNEAYRLLARLAPALDSAHAKGIIHRDIKPANILFDEYGEPYIADFGIAKITESQGGMTGSGIVGTPAYMSPEQAQGEAVDGRSDIYGLGIILFEALTNQQPYSGDTPMSVVVKHITDPVPHILDIQPDLPLGIEKIIGKALAKDKNERFATCQELADSIGSVARGETLVIGATPTESRMSPPASRVSKKPMEDQKTIQTKPEPVAGVQKPKKGKVALVGILVGVFFLCFVALGALFLFRNSIPLLAQIFNRQQATLTTTPTDLPPVVETTPTDQPPLIMVATDTLSPTDSPTLTPEPRLPTLGGTDLIAILKDNNIWLMEVDGSNLRQLTTDSALKHSLQWSPDGNSILYISGKCINILDIETAVSRDLACFLSAAYLDDLSISPDGSQVAISLDRILYVVPYVLPVLDDARDHNSMKLMEGCFTYNELGVKGVRWSSDGKKIALELITPAAGGKVVDVIQLLDISACSSTSFGKLLYFPDPSSVLEGYAASPVIPAYDWDGEAMFVLNTKIRNDSYGHLYSYNTGRRQFTKLNPVSGNCCYGAPGWSADGTHIFFYFQDMSLGATSTNQLYFIPFGTIGTGAAYSPIKLPEDFVIRAREVPEVALRPAR